MHRVTAIGGFALALAACYRNPNDVSCTLTCSTTNATCPVGLACVDDFCVTPGTGPCSTVTPDGVPPDDTTLPPDVLDPLKDCPPSYQPLGSGRYLVVPITTNWPMADAACRSDAPDTGPVYTHLAAITSDAERVAVMPIIVADTWIGLSDAVTEGKWHHVSGEDTGYPGESGPPWGNGEPNGGSMENCAHLRTNGAIHDFQCGNAASVPARLCECDLHRSVLAPAQ